MDSKPLVSVIVPIYNVEQYLNECLTSITLQTYHNIEIILIDDKSPDNCADICELWRKKDNRITVIHHKQNKGLAGSRNTGLDICTGEYITFVDSDDIIDKAMIEVLMHAALESSADIVACSAQQVDENNVTILQQLSMPDTIYHNNDALREFLYCTNKILDSAWGKLYKASLFRDTPMIRFPFGLTSEDFYVNALTFHKSRIVQTLSQPLYFYRMRIGSICHSRHPHFSPHSYDRKIIGEMIQTALNHEGYHDSALNYYVMQKNFDVLFSLVKFNADNSSINKQKHCLASAAETVYHDKKISFTRKARIWFFSHLPKLYYRLNMLLH